jgi:hypothetical protein
VAVVRIAVRGEDGREDGPEMREQGFARGAPRGQDDGEGGVEEEVARDDFGRYVKFGWDGGAVQSRHGGLRVRKGGQRDAVDRAAQRVIEREAHVVKAQDILGAGKEMAVKIQTVSLRRRGAGTVFGTRGRGPGVKDVAPGAEPVARECTFDEGFDGSALDEAGFGAVDIRSEVVGSKGVVDVAAA